MKKYSGFTLIEMLIVMGIIIILMAAGIAGGRFAIQRANRIQKINSVDNIEQALWGYYTDNRSFPRGEMNDSLSPSVILESEQYLKNYLDAGLFDGGVQGEYWYVVDSDYGQYFVICAELSGDTDLGIYCTGNGLEEFAEPDFTGTEGVPADKVYPHDFDLSGAGVSTWNAESRSWD